MSELKKYLPRGTQQALSVKYGVSGTYISLVLMGKKSNNAILDEAIGIAEKEKARKDEDERVRQKRIEKLTA